MSRKTKQKQTEFFKKQTKAYGGSLLKTRKGRSQGRPLDTKNTMHLILKSSQAKGEWSFKKPENDKNIRNIIEKFSVKYGVKILSLANVGNHLHFHLKLNNRYTYRAFIRALTSAIAMAVTKASRIKPLSKKFWDYRPFTRVIVGFRTLLTLKDYIFINQLEGIGHSRTEARWILNYDRKFRNTA